MSRIKAGFRWTNRNRDWLLPLFVIAETGVIFVLVLGLISGQHEANIASCDRGNEARVASVKEKRQSVQSLNKQLRFWDAALEQSKGQPPSPLTGVFLVFIEGLREERATKHAGIREAIESQASVAVRPGSPEVDCALAYPG